MSSTTGNDVEPEVHEEEEGGGGNPRRCAACKYLRRRCGHGCVLAPYFPASRPRPYANVHRVFGASNVARLLQVTKNQQLVSKLELPIAWLEIHIELPFRAELASGGERAGGGDDGDGGAVAGGGPGVRVRRGHQPAAGRDPWPRSANSPGPGRSSPSSSRTARSRLLLPPPFPRRIRRCEQAATASPACRGRDRSWMRRRLTRTSSSISMGFDLSLSPSTLAILITAVLTSPSWRAPSPRRNYGMPSRNYPRANRRVQMGSHLSSYDYAGRSSKRISARPLINCSTSTAVASKS